MCKSKKLSLPNKNQNELNIWCCVLYKIHIPVIKNSFHKQERLCSKKQMKLLFDKGQSAVSYPLKAVYLETPVNSVFPAQAMFVAPKRSFKHAHDRNKLKRRMREVYRLNKLPFYEVLKSNNKNLLISFIYIGKKQEEFRTIEKSILKLMQFSTKLKE